MPAAIRGADMHAHRVSRPRTGSKRRRLRSRGSSSLRSVGRCPAPGMRVVGGKSSRCEPDGAWSSGIRAMESPLMPAPTPPLLQLNAQRHDGPACQRLGETTRGTATPLPGVGHVMMRVTPGSGPRSLVLRVAICRQHRGGHPPAVADRQPVLAGPGTDLRIAGRTSRPRSSLLL
jgi:hypothetical protein